MTQTTDESLNSIPEGQPVEPETSLIAADRFPHVAKSEFRAADGTPTFIVPAADITDVIAYLRYEGRYDLLADITALDWYPAQPRFQVVYNLLSISARQSIRVKVELDGNNPTLPSMTEIFAGANWYEREIFDLFGINFEGHPDLRRIEMPEDWDGHPLRKDYPVTGPRRPNLPANTLRFDGRNGGAPR